jgi:hypothetical protein
MDPATIQQIAAEVARHLPSYAWMPLLVAMVLMATAGAVGAFFGEYFRTRGKNLATKADFESLQNQLKANTELVETIKSEVAQKDWAQREWTTLRRTKLEALLEKMHNCNLYLERLRDKSVLGEDLAERERDPFSELDTIVGLYFPELLLYVVNFRREGQTQVTAAHKFRRILTSTDNEEVIQQRRNEYFAWCQDHAAKLIGASTELTFAARRLLVSIMGVED